MDVRLGDILEMKKKRLEEIISLARQIQETGGIPMSYIPTPAEALEILKKYNKDAFHLRHGQIVSCNVEFLVVSVQKVCGGAVLQRGGEDDLAQLVNIHVSIKLDHPFVRNLLSGSVTIVDEVSIVKHRRIRNAFDKAGNRLGHIRFRFLLWRNRLFTGCKKDSCRNHQNV